MEPNPAGRAVGDFTPPSPRDLDAVLDGYEFFGLLGHGGMGAVYKARQKSLDRLVAIKILPVHLSAVEGDADFHFSDRFQREARAMAKLSHPHIVAVFDFGQTRDGQFYFVMEYVEGTDLQALIKTGQLTPAHVSGWMGQICEALQYAHAKGIVHRDIKPANIMITREGQVKVADFGLAKLGGPEEMKLTMTNMAMGTPDYVAPETLEGGVEVDHRADLYALGVMLYEMLTGKVPRGNWKPPSALVPGLDPRFDDLVARAIEADRDERIQQASEIGATLYRIATTAPEASRPGPAVVETAPAQPPPQPQKRESTRPQRPVAPPQGRSPAGWIAGIAVGCAAIGLGVFVWIKPKLFAPDPPVAMESAPPAPADLAPEPVVPAPTVVAAKADPVAMATAAPEPEAKPLPAPEPAPEMPEIPQPTLTNSLGMGFVPLPGTDRLICRHETRRGDYAAYAEAVPGVDPSWKQTTAMKRDLPAQDDHPVCLVSWDDAVAFCRWLSAKEGRTYRLPTEHEWNLAVAWDLPNPDAISEPELSQWIGNQFPWGTIADTLSGNYSSSSDPYPGTAPVMSFQPNQHGIFDLGGNVWEWCDDPKADSDAKPMRGCGFLNFGPYRKSGVREFAPSDFRIPPDNDTKSRIVGFRVVLDPTPDPALTSTSVPEPAPMVPAPLPPTPTAALDPVSARLGELEKAYQAAYATQVAASHDQAVADLNANYSAALDRAIATASAASELDEALALRDEKTLVGSLGRIPGEDAPDLPASLTQLRKTWRAAHAPLVAKRDEATVPLLATYDRTLAAYQDELTRAQNLDGAARVKAVRDQVSSQGPAGVAAAVTPIGGSPAPSSASAGVPVAPPLRADQVLPPLPKASPDEIRALCDWALTRDTARLDLLDSARPVTVVKGEALPRGAIKLIGFELERFPLDDEGLKWLAILGRAPDLERLEFSSATDRIPLELLRGATKLKELTPIAAVYDETAFAHLAGLKNLEKLTIMPVVQEFTGTALGYVPDNLVELNIDSPTLTAEGMAYLPRFKKLKRLSFDHFNSGSRCNINDAMLRGLASLPALEDLNLFGCPVDGSFLASLPQNLKLKRLDLIYANSFDPANLVHLGKLTELRTLSLPPVSLPPDAMTALSELDGLEELIIFENPAFTGEEFRGLKGFRSLKVLGSNLSPVTDAGLAAISEALPGITRFDLASREDKPLPATAAGFAVFASRVKGLISLHLYGPEITDEWMPEVAKLTKVDYLVLLDTKVTDAGLVHLKDLLLGYFRLSGTGITDAAIPILKTFPKVGNVATDGTAITPAGRAALEAHLRSR